MTEGTIDDDLCTPDSTSHAERQPTVRTRLLLALNIPVAILGVGFLAYDYSQELTQRLQNKRLALEEEAKTLLPAVVRIHARTPGDVQHFVDDVCAKMHDADSPGHHIVVEIGGHTIQAVAHARASTEITRAMREAVRSPDRSALSGDTELIVGSYGQRGATVYVSEWLGNVREAAKRDILRRSAAFAIVATVAAVIVNVVLLRVVSKPLETLVEIVQQIGKGNFGVQSCSFRTKEIGYLAEEVNAMSQSLAMVEKTRRLQMAQAREIQRNLLPNGVMPDGMKIVHLFMPADDVGGDFFDILRLNDGSWLVCVADVSGHGIPAAMNAAMLRTILQQAGETHGSPAELLDIVNQRFTAVSLLDDFVSMILVCFEPHAGRLKYASAGHEPGWIVFSSGGHRELSSTGLLLGIDETASWEEIAIDVDKGDRLLIVTDGLSEARSSEGELFGRRRLEELVEAARELSADATMKSVNEALHNFRGDALQLDDMTALLLEVADY